MTPLRSLGRIAREDRAAEAVQGWRSLVNWIREGDTVRGFALRRVVGAGGFEPPTTRTPSEIEPVWACIQAHF